jgi:site-specific DNA-methyltransferase (adenine-specific)
MDYINKFINDDCMKHTVNMPDKCYDLAIVDPPYGIGISKRKSIGKRGKTICLTTYKQSNWDAKIPDKSYFDELFRISKNQIIWGGNYFSMYLPGSAGWFVWNKRQPEEFSMAHAELAFTSFDRAIRMKEFKRNEVQSCGQKDNPNRKIHQCQKPIALYKHLLKLYAKPGDKIIDTHVGSASSLIAFMDAGYEYTGFEIDKDYYDAACKRIEIYQSQLKLAI